MDPKRDFRLPRAAASTAKQFGISVATLKTLYTRQRRTRWRLPLACLAKAEAFNITDDDGGQPGGLLYK
eukprot:jgi/Tetstr1/457370/TSEL_043973.t1